MIKFNVLAEVTSSVVLEKVSNDGEYTKLEICILGYEVDGECTNIKPEVSITKSLRSLKTHIHSNYKLRRGNYVIISLEEHIKDVTSYIKDDEEMFHTEDTFAVKSIANVSKTEMRRFKKAGVIDDDDVEDIVSSILREQLI